MKTNGPLPSAGLKAVGLTGGYLLVTIIVFLDSTTPVNLAGFHLIPIALVSWFLGLRPGLIIAVVCALVSAYPDAARYGGVEPTYIRFTNFMIRLALNPIIALAFHGLRATHDREKFNARTDALTGLASRRFFLEVVELEIKRCARYQRSFSLSYIDLDNFKELNDAHGHGAGDQLLAKVGEVMAKHIRQSDIVARLGGDEFALFFPETGVEQAKSIIEHLRAELDREMAGREWNVTFSIGVVTFLHAPTDIEEVLKIADGAMYHVKTGNKNSVYYEVLGAGA